MGLRQEEKCTRQLDKGLHTHTHDTLKAITSRQMLLHEILMRVRLSGPYLLRSPRLLDRLVAGQASHYRYGNTWIKHEKQQHIQTFIWVDLIEGI